MSDKDKTKRVTLGKLDKLVYAIFRFYDNAGITNAMSNLSPKDTIFFSPEQYEEIRTNLERIYESLTGLITYCRDRDIDIPKDIFDAENIGKRNLSDEDKEIADANSM